MMSQLLDCTHHLPVPCKLISLARIAASKNRKTAGAKQYPEGMFFELNTPSLADALLATVRRSPDGCICWGSAALHHHIASAAFCAQTAHCQEHTTKDITKMAATHGALYCCSLPLSSTRAAISGRTQRDAG